MAHLTAILLQIRGKSRYFKGLYPKRQMRADFLPITNKYPNWVKTYQDYANFGKFVDYVIRKMLQNHFNDHVVAMETQAEKIDHELEQTRWVKTEDEAAIWRHAHPDDAVFVTNDPIKFENFVLHRKLRIAKYRDATISWRECLADLYYLALLDGLYENKTKLQLNPKITPEKVRETFQYLERIEAWLVPLLESAQKIYLNPTLSHQKTFGGEADLIVVYDDETILYDIKVVWNVKKTIRTMYWQLLGYAAMHQYLLRSEKKHPICVTGRVTKIGFIFPNQLHIMAQSITRWKDPKRTEFLQKMTRAAFWKKKK